MKPVVKEPVRAAMHQKLSNHEPRPRQWDGTAWHLNEIIAKSSKNSKKIPVPPIAARFTARSARAEGMGRSRLAKSTRLWVQLGIAEIGFLRRDIVGEMIQFFRNPAQHLLQVRLEGYVRQLPSMVSLRMIAG